ncbi:MAG: hypothetical protein MI924_30305 [Chloroflexales bacterium]|nr:hypothetical protein [Chloroflexales bacterium]
MDSEAIKQELLARLQVDIDHFEQNMPRENAIAWRGYFAALLEWNVIAVATHDALWSLLPAIESDPVDAILLGRE